MWLSQLRLVNFRNYRALRLEPEPGVLVFSGHNGQGKTNLLEAVYVLATTRSPRTSVERELLSWRTPEDADLAAVVPPFARLDARVRRLNGDIHLELTFEGERPSLNSDAIRPSSLSSPPSSSSPRSSSPSSSLPSSSSALSSSSSSPSSSSSSPSPSPSSWSSPSASALPSSSLSPSSSSAALSSSSSSRGAAGVGAVSRSIKVNGLATRATGLVGQLPVVYFSAADVDLAGGSPSARRQYLNVANSQVSPAHLRALQRYNRVLLQRNQVLRLVRERRQPPAALEPWTEQMIDWGSQILHRRLTMLADIDARVASVFADLAGSAVRLRVLYRSTVCDSGPIDARPGSLDPSSGGSTSSSGDAVRSSGDAARSSGGSEPPSGDAVPLVVPALPALVDMFRQRQAQLASREIDQAVSLVGPHRDDFAFVLDSVDLNTYGSRGQQRLAVLALKLAEADWMRASIGEIPVLLLDDMLAELDPERRAYVLHRVTEPDPSGQRQVWITTTELDLSPGDEFLTSAQRFVIEAGQVRKL